MELIGLLIFGVVAVSFLIALWRSHEVLLRNRVDAAAAAMDTVLARSSDEVRGIKDGCAVSVRIYTEQGRGARKWILVGCELPAAGLALELRRQGPLQKWQIRHGQAIDVKLGDPAFDDAWLVEGAPADIVRRVLDAETRERLSALYMEGVAQPDDRHLLLRAEGWRDPQWIREAVAVMAKMATAVEPAFAASDSEASARAAVRAAPYRGDVVGTDAPAQRASELAGLRQARDKRFRAGVIAVLIGISIVAIGILMVSRFMR